MRMIFSFDTEDFVTPEADDALKGIAETLTRHGLRASFGFVADKVRALLARGRQDVIEACKPHDIQYHSNNHMFWPQTSLAISTMNWDDGVDFVVATERHGVEMVEEVFGRRPLAWIRPDTNQAAREMYGMRLLGLRAMVNCSYCLPSGGPIWYVGMLLTKYNFSFERYTTPGMTIERMQSDLLNLKRKRVDTDVPIIMGCHPCMLATETFYDLHNIKQKGVVPPKEDWEPAPFVGAKELKRRLDIFDSFVQFVRRQDDIEVITHSEFLDMCHETTPWVTAVHLVQLATAIKRDFSYHKLDEEYFSVADIFGMMSGALLRWRVLGAMPESIPVRRILGPPEPCNQAVEPGEAAVREVAAACSQVEAEIEMYNRVPSVVELGARPVPPSAFLRAMADAVTNIAGGDERPVRLQFQPAYPRCQKELFEVVHIGAHSLPPDFDLGTIKTYTHQQTWTVRPAVVRRR